MNPKIEKVPGLVKSLEILNQKSKVNNFYLITFNFSMFCRVDSSSKDVTKTGNGERGTGNGERGTEV